MSDRQRTPFEAAFGAAYGPRPMGETVIADGDLTHEHALERVPWDRPRLGPDAIDSEGWMITYRDLYRCSCGREKIVDTRALI